MRTLTEYIDCGALETKRVLRSVCTVPAKAAAVEKRVDQVEAEPAGVFDHARVSDPFPRTSFFPGNGDGA